MGEKKIFTSKVFVNDEMKKSVNDVFDSGIFSMGDKNKEFEKKFAEYCGAKHAIAVSNGTIAIEIVLCFLGITEGDEIIVPSHTTMPTVEPILNLNAKPVFVDVLEETYVLNPKEVEKSITGKTKAVLAVHLYGNSADLNALKEICDRHKIFLVEDCAQAHGTKYDGKHVGTFGITGCFSFFPTKNMTVCGEGGMIITNDDYLAKNARMLRNHGEEGRYNHVVLGGNHRLSEIHCAIGIEQLKLLDYFIQRRREIAEIYNSSFRNNPKIIIPQETDNTKHSYHLYVIRVDRNIRDKIISEFAKENIFLGIHYPKPVHLQEITRKNTYVPILPVTEKIVSEIISLPMYPLLKNEEAEMIADKINKITKNERFGD
ncbi:MAG: DegT/DnrJ/EryC1/StrS family aminotransferase, partial [Nanoarchaeota archaeon]